MSESIFPGKRMPNHGYFGVFIGFFLGGILGLPLLQYSAGVEIIIVETVKVSLLLAADLTFVVFVGDLMTYYPLIGSEEVHEYE